MSLAYKVISKELLTKPEKPYARLKSRDGKVLRLEDHIRAVNDSSNKNVIAEFISSDQFSASFKTRQVFEVNAGREQEPILYTSIYNVVEDSSLPEFLEVNALGPAGVVLEKITEGGEVKFMTVGETTKTIRQIQYGVGLQYTKRMAIFNNVWQMAFIERQVGVAYNALMNHLHLSPILDFSYTSANQTAAVTSGDTAAEDIMLTLQAGIAAAKADSANPRRGAYALLIAGADEMRIRQALLYRLQDSGGAVPPGLDQIQDIIVYDGWTGRRGAKETSYPGVTSGKVYLVNKQYRSEDFQSWVKQPLQSVMGNSDASRFILEETIWDCFIGVYADPAAAVEEITLP